MGCAPSSRRDTDPEFHSTIIAQHNTSTNPSDEPRPETQILAIIKQEYNDNFELFVVNNLLLSVQFFENFNEDIRILQPNSEREIEILKLNERLLQKYQKRIILPDTLHEKVNRNIIFQRPNGPDKGKSESFLPERLFIVDDNVEISHEDECDYNNIDNNTFRAVMIATDNVGFVKLRQMDLKDASTTTSSKSSTDSLGKDIYIDPQPSTSSAADIIESNYAELDEARSKKPLVLARDRHLYSTIPKRCIVPVPLVKTETEYNEQQDNYIQTKTSVTEYFISSKEMARYFVHTEFPSRIASVLDFTSAEVEEAERMLATIYLQSHRSGYQANYEVTPVLDIQWPSFSTVDWRHRKPKKIIDKVNQISYEWPSNKMKDIMQKYQCVVIPRGFLQKYGTNKDRALEWEMAFPRVEKYLQTTMSHSQIRTYFFLLLLQKSFIEPITQHQGITPDHIKMIMYWEIEYNFLHWPETRMARKLKQILMRLEGSLSHRRLQHYFHHHKNIFGNIQDQKLYKAQTIINNIIRNPVAYVISALRNIQYTNLSSTYPTLDYMELYRLLKDTDIVAAGVPKLERKKTVTFRRANQQRPMVQQKEPDDPVIDLNWVCKIGTDEPVRRQMILKLFINHFIEIGKQSSIRMITSQAQLYLQHAMDLTLILAQEDSDPTHRVEVNTFMRQIEMEQSRVKRVNLQFESDPMESPALPSRLSTLGSTTA